MFRRESALAVCLVAALGCSSAPRPRHALSSHGAILRETVRSASLGVDKHVLVWLPAGYEGSHRRYPVIFLLHGLGGDETDWERLGLSRRADALGLGAIVVMPDGDDSFYANWAEPVPYEECLRSAPSWRRPRAGRPPPEDPHDRCVRRSRYEDWIAQDLVTWVDRRFRTRADRTARGVGGLSMGGFGAFMLAMRHPDVFSVAVSHSGPVSLLYARPQSFVAGHVVQLEDLAAWGRAWDAFLPGFGDHVRRILGPDPSRWRAHDPATLGATLEDGVLALSFDCGSADGFRFDDQALHLDEVLRGAGVAHELTIVPGGTHDDRYFASRLDTALRFFSAHLAPTR